MAERKSAYRVPAYVESRCLIREVAMGDVVSLVNKLFHPQLERVLRLALACDGCENIGDAPVLVVPNEVLGLWSLHPRKEAYVIERPGCSPAPQPSVGSNEADELRGSALPGCALDLLERSLGVSDRLKFPT